VSKEPLVGYECILYAVADPIATITLNRPDVLNAYTDQMGIELRDAFGRAERDQSVVGIVLTGAGRGFCAGADMNLLSELSGASGTKTEPFLDTSPIPGDPGWGEDLRGTYTYMLSIPKPVICVLNGAVAGMGLPIALACDLRFMSAEALITTAFASRGLIAEWGTSWLLAKLVGPATTLDLLYSARKIGGTEAEHMGLVNRTLPADQVLDYAVEYITGLAQTSSPTSMAVMKRQVYTELHRGLADAQGVAACYMMQSFESADFQEGVGSFLERRRPSFARIGQG
jgi:enoyl-CoA hydratase/carnithine racemase